MASGASGLAVDRQGNAWIAGHTVSDESTFPTGHGFACIPGFDQTYKGGGDAFVVKIDSSGTAFDYATYLGGTGDDEAQTIAVDSNGNAYVTGWTNSTESTFPGGHGFGTIPGPDTTYNGGPHGPRFFPSSNIAVPAARFAELGGFDEAVRLAGGEDRDFCERWLECGWPMAAAPDALVRHSHDLGLRGFWRQHVAYGAGAYRHRHTRAARTGDRRLEPSLTSGVFGIAARRAIADRDPGRLALLGVWQAATTVGFVGAGPNPAAQGNIPYNAAAAQMAMKWDPAKDEAEGNACKAYGAGGIMRDLFESDDGGWLTDPALLDRLVDEKLRAEGERIGAEGWKWVAVAVMPCGHFSARSCILA